MSHDFVEAGLMRRGGWAIHMVPGVDGSYEEVPPTLTDLAVRDRRWCQGNLQHAAVLPTRGLYAISRLHLLTGIGSYLTAPLWLLFILTGILIAVQARFVQPDYFPAGKSLFPQWPVVDPVRAMWMFVGTMALLLLPKLFGCVAVLVSGRERRGCGGMLRLLAGLVLETIIAGLMAPVVMLTQTIDVAAILMRTRFGLERATARWRRDPGARNGAAVSAAYDTWRAARRGGLVRVTVPGGVDAAGGAWAGACDSNGAVDRARFAAGNAVAHAGADGAAACRVTCRRVAARMAGDWRMPDIAALLNDTRLLRMHEAMLPPPRRPRIDPIDVTLLVARAKLEEADGLQPALAALTTAELATALGDAVALRRLVSLASGDPRVSAAA